MKRLVFFFLLLMVFRIAGAQNCVSDRYGHPVFAGVDKTSQVLYGNAVPYGIPLSEDLYLDIYEPHGDTLHDRPLMIYSYGGAYLIGDKNQPPINPFCDYFARCGYVVVSIDYRKGFNAVDPSSPVREVYRAAQDERAAMRFLCQRAAQYRLDTAAIFLTGSSAGCFSALHQTFLEESQRPAETYGTTLEPANLGCFDCSGNTEFNLRCPRVRGIINNWGAILDTSFIEGNKRSDSVAVISFHGDQDNLVPYVSGSPFSYPLFPTVYGSKSIHRRMDNQHMKNKLVPLVGEGHEPWLLNPSLKDTVYKYACPFLLEVLTPAMPLIGGIAVICNSEAAVYSAAVHAGSHYCWQLDSGGVITAFNNNSVTVLWQRPGNFKLKLREITKNDVNSEETQLNVTVLSRPEAKFGDSVFHTRAMFSDSSVNGNIYFWNFGDGDHSPLKNPSHDYSVQGNFNISEVVGNGYCADTFYRFLVTDTCPAVDFFVRYSGDSVTFIPDPATGQNIAWLFGDGDSSGISNPSHIYSNSQNYLVTLKMVAGNNCRLQISKIVNFTRLQTGLNQVYDNLFAVNPNPFSDNIFINSEAPGDLKVFNSFGALQNSFSILKGGNIIDLKEFPTGLYFLQFTSAAFQVARIALKE